MPFNIPETYELIERKELSDIHAEGIFLRHKKTAARILLLPCADENKVFNIVFRTPPSDSTGVAHINEHCVLCGSEKYPLKDPFVELAKGSLNTFLNAMTYPDKTMYPIASTNDKDFRNLTDVYLDAVFYPNTYREKHIFEQEGWSYHMDSPDDPLTVSGVVYNEMKGAFSSPDEVLEREIMNALFPDTAYGVESGGDPDCIPDLTYEGFLDFHRKYYHPSNSYIMIYGNADMEDFLLYLDREYLSAFEKEEERGVIARQEAFTSPVIRESVYPLAAGEDPSGKAFHSYSAVLGDRSDMRESIAIDVLDYALLSSPGAPIRQRLIDEGIGEDVYGGYSDGILQPYYSVICKNAKTEDRDRFREIIRDVLTECAENGIDKKALLAGLNNMEFSFREGDFGTIPKGLMYTINVMDTWLYNDSDPFTPLCQLDAFASLRREIEEDTGYFEALIRRLFLGNPHAALVTIRPESGLQERRDAELVKTLAEKKDAMSAEEIGSIVENTKALTAWQMTEDTKEALASLPRLKRSDLKREVRKLSNIEEKIPYTEKDGSEGAALAVLHETESNGIVYFHFLFPADGVDAGELTALSLLRSILMYMDTEAYSYGDLNHLIDSETGGIACDLSIIEPHVPGERPMPYFAVKMKALAEKADKGLSIAEEFLLRTKLDDKKRLREILLEANANISTALLRAGNQTALRRAASCYSEADLFRDRIAGIAFARSLKALAAAYDSSYEELRKTLESLIRRIFSPKRAILSITGDAKTLRCVRPLIGPFLSALAGSSEDGEAGKLVLRPAGAKREGMMTAGQVQYVGLSGNFAAKGYAYTGKLLVLRQILTLGYLWEKVRVEGNAYGCGARFDRTGKFELHSYRDPNLGRTVDVFRALPDFIRAFDADEEEMTKYVIGTVSQLDVPLPPSLYGTVCLMAWIDERTDDDRRKEREEVLTAESSDIRALADLCEAVISEDCICVVGSESAIRKEEAFFTTVEKMV